MNHLVATRLDDIMYDRRITNAELARQVRMQPGLIGWIRTGRFLPYPSQLQKIASALGIEDAASLVEDSKGARYGR